MRLIEHDGKALLASAGIAIPRGVLIEASQPLHEAPWPAASARAACACCCWAAPTLAKCRPASGTQPPAKPAPRQASRCCKQVFHTKIQKAGYHPHGGTLPLFVFCLYPGRNSSSPVPPPNKKSPDECLRIFCGGELGTRTPAPLRGQQRAACAGEISIQFHTASQLRYSAGS